MAGDVDMEEDHRRLTARHRYIRRQQRACLSCSGQAAGHVFSSIA